QQDALALVPEVFGDGRRTPCAVQTHQGRIVGRRRNDDRARKSLFAEDALHELLDLATALADQPDDDHFRAGIARHHAEQHALADAAACEKPDALAAPDSEKRIDRANADVERLLDRLSRERVDRSEEHTSELQSRENLV